MTVWRSGRMLPTMRLIWGSKPMSSMRSASSRTRKVTRQRLVIFATAGGQDVGHAAGGADHDLGPPLELPDLAVGPGATVHLRTNSRP